MREDDKIVFRAWCPECQEMWLLCENEDYPEQMPWKYCPICRRKILDEEKELEVVRKMLEE